MSARLAIALVASVGLGACGGGDAGKMREIKAAMCACKDRACLKKVEKDHETFLKSLEEKFVKGEMSTEVLELVGEIEACEQKVKDDADAAHAEDGVKQMVAFKDRMCACKAGDNGCAKKVNDEVTAWSVERAKDPSSSVHMPLAMAEKMGAASKDFTDCMTKAMTPP